MVAGLVLTGGASRRMGYDKAGIMLDGERLADRAARVLARVCDPVLEVGPGRTSLDAVADEERYAGPLAALVTGATALRERGHSGAALLLGVDLPFVDAPLLQLLVDHPAVDTVTPVADGMRQSCCTRYSPQALETGAELVRNGERALHALLSAVRVVEVAEAEWRGVAPPDAFADLDSPGDLVRHGIDGRQ